MAQINLNQEQLSAVTAPLGNYLILAGAGTGKTRVLVERIVYLIDRMEQEPTSIMAVTFTNKAAKEIKQRINQRFNDIYEDPFFINSSITVGTFHSVCISILRSNANLINYSASFKVMDTNDKKKFIKQLLKNEGYEDESDLIVKFSDIVKFIEKLKEENIRASYSLAYFNDNKYKLPFNSAEINFLSEIYGKYEEACKKQNVMDFNEILLATYELFVMNPNVLQKYQRRYSNILVDECQDTNTIQYNLIRLLNSTNSYFMLVGDDDQSIYGWRGAVVGNMKLFLEEFKEVQLIKLEKNYRSYEKIINLANEIIKDNDDRIGKNLVPTLTQNSNKDHPVRYTQFYNELDESKSVVRDIKKLNDYSNTAILYRNNFISRTLETELNKAGIPYVIYGGMSFYERKEIKDTIAYLSLIVNQNDNVSLMRIINTPRRGIGEKIIVEINELANRKNLTLWQSIEEIIQSNSTSKRVVQALTNFHKLITYLIDATINSNLESTIKTIVTESGLQTMYIEEDQKNNDSSHSDNINELLIAASDFLVEDTEENQDVIVSLAEEIKNIYPSITNQHIQYFIDKTYFINNITLNQSQSKAVDNQEKSVSLLTIHSSKGLEFNNVFLVACDEGIMPRFELDKKSLEEERRLLYVAVTRAKQKLFISFCTNRKVFNTSSDIGGVSSFLSRIDKSILPIYLTKKPSFGYMNHTPYKNKIAKEFPPEIADVNKKVKHHLYGDGIIIGMKPSDKGIIYTVAFFRSGIHQVNKSECKLI